MTLVSPDRPLIGDQIRRARHRRDWTQAELAKRVGADRKTVDNWENNRTYPRNVVVLEDVLGVTLNGEDERTLSAEGLEEKHRQVEAALEAALAQLRGNGHKAS